MTIAHLLWIITKFLIIFFVIFGSSAYYYQRQYGHIPLVYYYDIHGKCVAEKNNNNGLIYFLYDTNPGRIIRQILRTKLIQHIIGWYYSSSWSKRHIEPFVNYYHIDKSFFKEEQGYISFNDFFIRHFIPSARPISTAPVICPTDGKVFVIPHITASTNFTVKKSTCNIQELIKDQELAEQFEGGTLFVIRLAPYDYHRFHFPLTCTPAKSKVISGTYESVNPFVLDRGINPWLSNERHLIELTYRQHLALMMPVGALFVGAIRETYIPGKTYAAGDEAGYFMFGGSSLLLLFKKDHVVPRKDLLEHSQAGYETAVNLGESLVQES